MQKKIIFFGTPEFAVPALHALLADPACDVLAVVTQPDKPRGRGHKVQPSPIKEIALTNDIPVLQPKNIRREVENFISELKTLEPLTMGVVVAFGQIIPEAVLNFPEHGSVNIHGSLLPRWRGAAPMQRAIMEGDLETGVCIMQMDAGLDTGAVYSQQAVDVTNETTLATLHDTLAELGANLLIQSLPGIVSGELPAIPQSSAGVTYAKKIEPVEARIDWALPADKIVRLIHGLNPFPGAYTLLNGRRIKLFLARQVKQNGSGKPGQILYCDRNRLEIQCGRDSLQILEAQMEGKRRMKIADFLRGVEISSEDMFTSQVLD